MDFFGIVRSRLLNSKSTKQIPKSSPEAQSVIGSAGGVFRRSSRLKILNVRVDSKHLGIHQASLWEAARGHSGAKQPGQGRPSRGFGSKGVGAQKRLEPAGSVGA